ncbi:hypothetical protein [Corynebacterium deserti]|nr:hypothetical protein [Corynebacterium deserti]
MTKPDGPLSVVMPRGTWGQVLRSWVDARFERIKNRAHQQNKRQD